MRIAYIGRTDARDASAGRWRGCRKPYTDVTKYQPTRGKGEAFSRGGSVLFESVIVDKRSDRRGRGCGG